MLFFFSFMQRAGILVMAAQADSVPSYQMQTDEEKEDEIIGI